LLYILRQINNDGDGDGDDDDDDDNDDDDICNMIYQKSTLTNY